MGRPGARRGPARCRCRPTSPRRPPRRRLRAWDEADRAARPGAPRPAARRASPAAGVDAYFGVRREEIRYLTGVVLGDGEEKVAGHSGRFLVTADEVVVLADSRYTLQVRREAPGARIEDVTYDLAAPLAGAPRLDRRPPRRRAGRRRLARAVGGARRRRAGRGAGRRRRPGSTPIGP